MGAEPSALRRGYGRIGAKKSIRGPSLCLRPSTGDVSRVCSARNLFKFCSKSGAHLASTRRNLMWASVLRVLPLLDGLNAQASPTLRPCIHAQVPRARASREGACMAQAELPRNIKEMVSQLRESVQAALSARESRIAV